MVHEAAVSHVNCLEGNQLLLEVPTCQASRHRDKNMLCTHPRSSGNAHGSWFAASSRQGPVWRSPITMNNPVSLPPMSPSENLPKITVQNKIDHFKKQKLRIIHPLWSNRDSLKTPRWGFILNFHSIYDQLFTHKHLSGCFQILCLI